ncbi:tyrosine-type recombinase/integrase [Clostridium tarantellae]|uniref:tyrosine-type recombinase/integrase n=1 Tax=Clostridium tarantellae TaxID=39493 RepID=UPI002E12DD58|nr:tyrosine-type recombinase/integrase [Clostridium tarantellae]
MIYIKDFLNKELEKGLNKKTVNKYASDLKQFCNFIKFKEDIDIKNLDHSVIQKNLNMYISYLEKQNYKPSTINGKIIIINKYFKFLEIDCYGKCVKIQKKIYIDNVITEGEYKRLLDQCRNNYRDKAIIMTLANTGLRVSELLSLKIDDVKKINVFVKGKGGKYREVFLSNQLKNILKEYIKEYRLNTDNTLLFTGYRGPLKRQAINQMLSKYAKKGHISKNKAHPHSLRHLFGKRLAESGVSLDLIQTYLGHENISTTAIYTKRTKEELERTLEYNFI